MKPAWKSRRVGLVALVGAAGLVLTGCQGGASPAVEDPAAALARAKVTLDNTSGVHLKLSTDDFPDGVTGAIGAEGDATHAPAFAGTITVKLSGLTTDIDVRALDGQVHAKLPPLGLWTTVNPGDYGAPDPAALMDPNDGISSLLDPAISTHLKAEASRRSVDDASEVITPITATVSAAAVAKFIPSARGADFTVVYEIAGNGELRAVELTGQFYADTDPMTYRVTLTDYGSTPTITAP